MESTTNVNTVSHISAGTVIKGDITSQYDIRIDGQFDGSIATKGRVVIGDKAKIKGCVLCSNTDIWGKVEGDVFVKGLLSLKSGCSIVGDIHVGKLEVEVGSEFNGTCKMITEQEFNDKVSAPKPEANPQAGISEKA